MSNKIDLTDRRFGMLVVKEDSGERTSGGDVKWVCECDCTKKTIVSANNLKKGFTKSCGCNQHNGQRVKNLIGKEFDKLTVVEFAGFNKYGVAIWVCECECGSRVCADTGSLRSRNTKSCNACREWGKRWKIQSPSGNVYEFRNLSAWLREHEDLYNGTPRNAYIGIAKIKSAAKNNLDYKHWKGWKLLEYDD